MKCFALILVLCILGGCLSCGPQYTSEPTVDAYQRRDSNKKIEVEAYLFDARIYRNGKPTSFRLHVYRTDSIIALGGRGYFGKGALKGIMTHDSVIIYFPATNEYLRDSRSAFFNQSVCPSGAAAFDFQRLLTTLPDETFLFPAAVAEIESKKKRRKYSIIWPDCDWNLDLDYQKKDIGWRPKEIKFNNGDDIRFTAETRVFKPNAKVSLSKFRVNIPADAIPLRDSR